VLLFSESRLTERRNSTASDRNSYGKPIHMIDYDEDFLSGDDVRRRLAVKRLTRKIDLDMRRMTVNAPDWQVSVFETSVP